MFRRVATVAAALGVLASCAGTSKDGSHPADSLRDTQRYLCCNLFIEPSARWISDHNIRQPLMVPAGTPVKVAPGNRRTRTVISWDAGTATIGHEYGTREESTEDFLRKILIERDPRPVIAQAPPLLRQAISSARVMPGMTKPQVLMAIGYPPTHYTATPALATWTYFTANRERYEVLFDANGVVKDVAGLSSARSSVLFGPGTR